ncbi:MAG: O-antigen ligase family protein [Burkholderiaceae bacterium]|nr:O-antigen ligase family protein [Burkholderiaceae bacterium]
MNAESGTQIDQSNWRQRLPERVVVWLPLTLFFPVGLMYAGLLIFLFALLASGDFSHKWQNIKRSPMLLPICGLSGISLIAALTHERPVGEFWSAFAHYQTYLFLLPFLALGAGTQQGKWAWQEKAQTIFFAGAVIAAALFYLNALKLLPKITGFKSYVEYNGNKSILLAVLLAVAAGWMISDWRWKKHQRHTYVVRGLALAFVVSALFLLAKSRTASLSFLVLCLLMLFRHFDFSVRKSMALFAVLVLMLGALFTMAQLPPRVTCFANEMSEVYHMNPASVIYTRAVCTVHQVRDFQAGKQVSEDGMRLEIYKNTSELILQNPIAGHGIGNWLPLYQAKARGQVSETMTTPHNDYLLYATELGLLGLAALLWLWFTQLKAARSMVGSKHYARAMPLLMLTITMMIGGMFNAILRDAVFGLAFMILLAIPMAGVEKSEHKNMKRHE